MDRDPYHEKIIEKLASLEDGDLFERCVCDLLHREYPTLVPIEGGGDAGVDGAIVEDGLRVKLICTIQEDVIGNVTKSLDAQRANGTSTGNVLVVTSQYLSPVRCRNIEKRVREKGFELYHDVYARGAIAKRIYHDSRWCRELLGIEGLASALGRFPRSIRPLRDLPLIGRSKDLEWLRGTKGDRLVVGQPGIGKTFLLQALVNEDRGLFVIQDDVNRIADAIRDQQPGIVIVEDAHLHLSIIRALQRFRLETGADYEIVADCWPGMARQVAGTMSIAQDQSLELKVIEPKEIVELVKASGIGGPRELIREFIRQSMGFPGRAATLIHICLSRGVDEFWTGEALARAIYTSFSELVPEAAIQALACFAVGGTRGMQVSDVADFLGYPPGEVHQHMAKLAMGGVVQDHGEDVLSVVPQPLGCAMVRDLFFREHAPMQLDNLIDRAPSIAAANRTLIGAKAYGAAIDSHNLLDRLERMDTEVRYYVWGGASDAEAAWQEFAWCDPAHASLILEKHPEKIASLSIPLIHRDPDRIIPALLERTDDDSVPPHRRAFDPLKIIEGWIVSAEPGTDEPVRRRQVLLAVLLKWLREGKDQDIGLRAIKFVFSPRYEIHFQEPGQREQFSFVRGGINLDELSEISRLWPDCFEVLGSITIANWGPLLAIIDELMDSPWIWIEVPEDYSEAMDGIASTMISDIGSIAASSPGVLNELQARADRLGLELGATSDADYQVLFPRDVATRDWKAREKQQTEHAEELAKKWLAMPREEVIAKLSWCVQEAQSANAGYPNLIQLVCAKIAAACSNAVTWLDGLLAELPLHEVISPFLRFAKERKEAGWEDRAIACLRTDGLSGLGISALIDIPEIAEEIMAEIQKRLPNYTKLVEQLCRFDHVSDERIAQMLEHEDAAVQEAAAVGLWDKDQKRQIPAALAGKWATAVVHSVGHNYHLVDMLEHDNDLAFAWLRDRATRRVSGHRRADQDGIDAAISTLSSDQRECIIRELGDVSLATAITEAVIGDDVDLYKIVLADKDRHQVHLAPLRCNVGDRWATLAIVALDAGIPICEIVDAAYSSLVGSYNGTIASQYEQRASAWSKLLSHSDPRIVKAAELGRANALEQVKYWNETERARESDELYS